MQIKQIKSYTGSRPSITTLHINICLYNGEMCQRCNFLVNMKSKQNEWETNPVITNDWQNCGLAMWCVTSPSHQQAHLAHCTQLTE